MSAADRSKAEIISRLRTTEAQLVLAQVRILKLECALGFYAAITNWDSEHCTSAGHDVLQIAEGCGWDVAKTALHGKTEAE
jgi:hypothetical protein